MAGEQMRKSMGTVAALGCMKMLLMVFNFVFWVTGIAVLALGIWMKVQLYIYFEITTANYSPTVAYALIGIGAAIVVVGMLGCCCTVKGNSVLLYIYAVFLVIIFIAELSAGISGFVYRGKLESNMESGLQAAMQKYATDDQTTKAMNSIQETLHCCGVDRYSDWFGVPWQRGQVNAVPDSCCRPAAKTCKHDRLPASTNRTLDVYTQGCHQLVVSFIDTNFGIIGGTVIGVSFFMLIGALLSCCLAKHINKSKYEQVA